MSGQKIGWKSCNTHHEDTAEVPGEPADTAGDGAVAEVPGDDVPATQEAGTAAPAEAAKPAGGLKGLLDRATGKHDDAGK